MQRGFHFWTIIVGLMLAVSCVAVARPPLIASEDAATNRVVTLLRGFGVKTALEKRNTERIISDGSEARPSFWKIVVGGEKPANQFQAYVIADGSLTEIYREDQFAVSRASVTGSGKPLPVLPRHKAMASALLKSVGSREPTRLQSFTITKRGIAKAYYSIYRNGYPFVSHSRFGYQFTFDTKNNQFLALKANENVPPVASDAPRLDKAASLVALKAIWKTDYERPALAKRGWKRYWYDLRGEPQLGYYLPEGKKTAILVWYMRLWANRDVGYAIQSGDSGMLIDAITGKQVKTRFVP